MVKVERSFPAPVSLEAEKRKVAGTYRTEEVIQRLRKDFHDKCYICEMNHLQNPEIEHRLPHHNGKDRDREFDWNNLFWACADCNKAKNKQKYEEGIIDCCKVDPEQLLFLCYEENGVFARKKTDTDDILINNTESLINEVFNKNNRGMRNIRSQERYRALQVEMNTFYRLLSKYDDPESTKDVYINLQEALDRKSAFAQIKRDYIRMHIDHYPGLSSILA